MTHTVEIQNLAVPPEEPSSLPKWRGKFESKDEISFKASRSGTGAGGQNRDKRSTKVEVRFDIWKSDLLSLNEKRRLVAYLLERKAKSIIDDGIIRISSSKERNQRTNYNEAVSKLEALITEALTPEKERIPTEKPEEADAKRLYDKRKQSDLKRSRSNSEE